MVGAKATAADRVEGTGETAYHFIQKAGAFGGEGELFATLSEVQCMDRFNRIGVVVIAVVGAVCAKIVCANQALGRSVHCAQVERYVAACPDIAIIDRLGASEVEAIGVAFAAYREAGVKLFADPADRFNLNAAGELAVQCTDQIVWSMLPIGIEMKALTLGMNAGIRASATMGFNLFGKHSRQCCFELILHGIAVGLALPSLEIGAVVGANTFPTHVQDFYQSLRQCKSGLYWQHYVSAVGWLWPLTD